ncbi:hypothetical protein SESBI_36465 [Sesbania bispinosa]|nr:hypothetical protein SESBI_36465 [Sesbania bispinosa]
MAATTRNFHLQLLQVLVVAMYSCREGDADKEATVTDLAMLSPYDDRRFAGGFCTKEDVVRRQMPNDGDDGDFCLII